MIVFIEKCSLLVDRLGHISECYIEVEQKGEADPRTPLGPPSDYAPASVSPPVSHDFIHT